MENMIELVKEFKEEVREERDKKSTIKKVENC